MTIGALSALMGLALAAVGAGISGAQKTPEYTPATTKVAILPILNTSGEKWEELRTRQEKEANSFLTKEFSSRKFTLVPSESVKATLDDLKLDMSDEENWKRENLYKVGEASGARLVMLAIITGTSQKRTNNFLSIRVEGWCDMKVWLVDVEKKRAIISAKTIRGESKHDDVFGGLKGSDLQVTAVANGLRDALKEFLAPYPAVTITKEGSGG